MEIGTHLKQIRTKRGFTLLSVAEAIGVTSGLLSQIENGKTSPSINTLTEILTFYRVPLSEFFKQLEKQDVVIVSSDEVETIKGKNGIRVSLLASKLDHNTLESYRVELASDEKLRLKSHPADFNGERFVLVVNGEIGISVGEGIYELKTGDSINFKSYLQCTVWRSSAKKAEIFVNGAPPVL